MNFWDKPKAPEMKVLLPMSQGIFSQMDYQWRAEITANQLDFLLVADYGKRNPSPVVDMVMEKYELPYDEQLTQQAMKDLADLMLMMYKPKWDKLAAVYDVEYDPIHNYLDEWEDSRDQEHSRTSVDVLSRNDSSSNRRDVESTRTDNLSQRTLRDVDTGETRTDDLTELETRNLSTDSTRTDNLSELTTLNTTDTRTDNLLETKNYGKTVTRTDNLSQTDSGSSGSKEHQIQAFNSNVYKNSDKDIFTGEGSNTRQNTGTQGTVDGGSDSKADTGTSALARTGSETVANSGTQRNDTDETGTVTTANTGTQTKSGSEDEDTTVTNTGTQSNVTADVVTGTNSRTSRSDQTDSGTETTERDGRHFGNIGNLTSQAQLREEIELWKWNYVKEILNDAKEFLCLSTYLNY